MNDTTFTYKEVTEKTESFIRSEIESKERIMSNDPHDVRILRHQITAEGAFYLWQNLTAGFQQKGDFQMLLKLTFPHIQS